MSDYVADRVWLAVARRGKAGATRAELADEFGLERNTMTKTLSRLVEGGFLRAEGETTARRFWAITKYGPPLDRRGVEFREGATEASAARYRKRYRARKLVRGAKQKGSRIAARALWHFWTSPVGVPNG